MRTLLFSFVCLVFISTPCRTAPAFVQVNSATPQGKAATVAVAFTKAQSAGNLNVIAIGWNDTTAKVASVTDKSGNTYTLATGPATVSGKLSQSLYYAKPIKAASANTLTVTFSTAATAVDVRVSEYSGLDPNAAIDATAGGTGTSTTASVTVVASPNTSELLVAAEITTTGTPSAGSGWTSRIITQPDSDLLEDRTITSAGSYSATAPISPSGAWVIQMIAFEATNTVTPPPPPLGPFSITSVVNGLANGTYTVDAPSFPGYTVMPVTQTLTINGANATATFTATASVVSNSVKLAWGAATTKACTLGTTGCLSASSIAGYNVYRSATSGGPYGQVNATTVAGLSYTDPAPPAGNNFYVTAAVDNAGDVSGFSNQVTANVP
jgi:hypothetical protein